MKTSILLVDDHAMLRSGLKQTLTQRDSFCLVGEAATGAQAIGLAKEAKPDVVLMDVHLPDMNGIEASRRILATQPKTKIIIFSSEVARHSVDEALEAGVCGYISKSGSVDEIHSAIDAVLQGKLYLSPDVSGSILSDYRKSLRGEIPPAKIELSDREKHLLRLVAQGRRNKEICVELNVGIKSVEAYRSRLMKKVGVSSSAELVRFAVREGFVQA